MKLPVSVLIMTQNEEANIRYALESVIADFDQVIVADSFSADRTTEICRQYSPVELYQHEFVGWAEQRNWMLANCDIHNEIVFFLDADEYVDNRVINELKSILDKKNEFSGLLLGREFFFLGRKLKYAHGHPAVGRIFKKQNLNFVGMGAREFSVFEGPAITMNSPYIHHDRSLLEIWIRKHNNNADREARLYLDKPSGSRAYSYTGKNIARRINLWVRENIWDEFPVLIRPMLYFFYRYILRMGFLDGKSGLVYCYLHGFWYYSLIDIKIIEFLRINRKANSNKAPYGIPLGESKHRLPISVLIMTQNEEANIGYALESVIADFDQVIVADSFSADRTTEICRQYSPVELYQHEFVGWAEQRNWMLANCDIHNEIVFFLDADEYVDTEFIAELRKVINGKQDFAAIYVGIKYIFFNTLLKHAYAHPNIMRIFKKSGLNFRGEGAREYADVATNTLVMDSPLVHHDRNGITVWINKHNDNAEREAGLYVNRLKQERQEIPECLSAQLRFKLFIRRKIWDNLPLLLRPFFYFAYKSFCKLGFLDGKSGLIYCYLHGFWYQSLIDIKIIEKLRAQVETIYIQGQ